MAKKRGHGEGSVYKLQSGRWAAAIVVGRNAAGKLKRKYIYGDTKRDVTEALSRLQVQKLDNTLQAVDRMTVGQYLDQWLETSAKRSLSPTSYHRAEGVVRLHIKPVIGAERLQRLTSLHIQHMLSTWEDDGKGPGTRLKGWEVIRRALNVAVKWKLLTRNPCDDVEAPRVQFEEIQPLDHEQVKKLLAETEGTRDYALFVMAVVTGMRQGELFGLQWESVNLEAGAVRVQHSLEEVKGVHRLKTTKSKASRRLVRIPAVLVEAMETHRANQMTEGNAASEYVFCDPCGGPIRKSNFLRRVWHPLREKLGLPDVRFHDLRHTSATLLLADGISPKVIQSRLGHSDIRLTLGTYSHVLPSMDDEAAGSFQTLLQAEKAKVS